MKTTFTKLFSGRWQLFICLFFLVSFAFGQNVPEYMYYKFDAPGNQTNYASAPVGNNPATLDGLTIGSTGEFGTALIGNGLTSSSNRLNTGWATNLPSTGWTISFWVNNLSQVYSSAAIYYFGDINAGSFRCFTGGVAGTGNLLVRGGGLTDTPITGIPGTPTVIHIVYSGTALLIYVNGVWVSQQAQPTVTISGAGPFLVGGYSSSPSFDAGALLDEWRLYNRALTATEITATWNQPLPLGGPPIVVTSAASSITSTGATLNGTVNANGYSTTVTFEYGLNTGYGSTITAAQSPVTGNTATPVSGAVSGLAPNTLYHYRVVGVNSAGTTNGNDMTFTTATAPPIVVTDAAAPIGLTTATLNGTVTAQNSSTTVTFQWGPSPALGNVVNATPGTVTGNTATPVTAGLTGLTSGNTYYYRCVGVNVAGTTNGATLSFVAGCPQIPPAGPITGPTSVCANSPGYVYSITPLINTTGYNWSVPPGAVITAGANTPSITVTFGTTSGNVSVYGTSTCASGAPSSTAVTVSPIPDPTITGSNNMCVNSGSYEYTTEAGFVNYTWTISSGGTITQGAGTHQIQVVWSGSGAQWVGVNYSTPQGCSALNPTILNVTVNPLPDPAGPITGAGEVCNGTQGVPYSVATIPNTTYYVWNLPPGASIASGTGTNSITVNFATDASSGTITVYGNNICGNGTGSPNFPVSVITIPDAAGTITGPSTVCAGSFGVAFSVPPITGATGYTWSLPTGATIASGANTADITVDFAVNAVSGSFTVTGTNACGTGTVSPDFDVTVLPKPDAPVITINGLILYSNIAEGNQWYYNGAPITDAIYQTLYAEYTGQYWDIVTVDGCESDTSNNIYVVVTGIGEGINSTFVVYPVPNDGRFRVTFTTLSEAMLTLDVYNYLGVRIYDTRLQPLQGRVEQVVDLRPVPGGVYTVVLRTSDNRVIRRILVNK
ncbi:MAG: hypothetical protein D4R67_05860 [Bacteroidetes bacterium]|nr:MAG: hypothetical protein D4R67_05860 [Bacteroidota bacterium]